MKTKLPLIAMVLGASWLSDASADPTREFSPIWRRNVFGLKEPIVLHSPLQVAPIHGSVKLTGIAAIPPQKWVVLWIAEPGEPAKCVALGEGGCSGALEVLHIDARAKQVKVRNAGGEMILTFEVAGSGAGPAIQFEDSHKPLPTIPPPEAGDP